MILSLNPADLRLLASPDHAPVREMLAALVEASLEDTMSHTYFPERPLTDGERAVLDAEARVLMGLRSLFRDASIVATRQAIAKAGAGNSPSGVV